MDNIENGAQGLPANASGGMDAAEKELRIFLVGFMGTGKSYWGRRLAQKLEIDARANHRDRTAHE